VGLSGLGLWGDMRSFGGFNAEAVSQTLNLIAINGIGGIIGITCLT